MAKPAKPTPSSGRPAGRPGPRGRTGPGRRGADGARGRRASTRPQGPTYGAARPRLTGRAAVLVLVLAVLVVSYASSMRAYLQQRSHLRDLDAQITERQASIDELEQEKRRWQDPAYLAQQARLSAGFVRPGDRTFTVLGADGQPIRGGATLQDPDTVITRQPTAWWDTAWQSVEVAGNPPKTGKPPAATIDGVADPGR